MKEFADDNFNSVENGRGLFKQVENTVGKGEIARYENGRKVSKRVENAVGKGEIARYEQFLLFPQCFQKACFPVALKGVIVWEWVKQHFQAKKGVRKIDHVVDPRATRRVAKTAILETPTCKIASKLPQLLLLTPMVHIATIYLPKRCAIACSRFGLTARHPCVGCVLARRHLVYRVKEPSHYDVLVNVF